MKGKSRGEDNLSQVSWMPGGRPALKMCTTSPFPHDLDQKTRSQHLETRVTKASAI